MSIFNEDYIDIVRKKLITELYDSEGDFVCSFPVDFTDEQIRSIFPTLNRIYNDGRYVGRREKVFEIKKALDIEFICKGGL